MSMKKMAIFARRYVVAAAGSLLAMTLGIFHSKGRGRIAKIAALFGYDPTAPKLIIPGVQPSEALPADSSVEVLEPQAEDGNVSPLEVLLLSGLVRIFKPLRLFEIGTFDGRTTLNMAANSPAESKVFTLDLPQGELQSALLPLARRDAAFIDKPVSGSRFRGTPHERKITQLLGDSARFDFSPFKGAMNFVFIDGSHSCEYVRSDTDQALAMLANGKGVLVWHDYGEYKGVTKALNELFLGRPEFQGMKHISGTTLVYLVIR
jgi:hypothetical protein